MHRRYTLGELRWPSRPGVDAIRRAWTTDAVDRLLEYVWQGYDVFRAEVLDRIDVAQAKDDLERSITQELEPRISRVMSGAEPFYIQHGRYEHATRKPAPAQPPQYDLAFVSYANENVCWPLEAKVLEDDTDVTAYVRDIHEQFLTCRYAPLSAEGAMVGYLVEGNTDSVFTAIASAVPCMLTSHPKFPDRAHKMSDHSRAVPRGESFLATCRCHHLLMPLT